jgi:MscS family membrane protein
MKLAAAVFFTLLLAYFVKKVLKKLTENSRFGEWLSTLIQSFIPFSTPLILGLGLLFSAEIAAVHYQFLVTQSYITQIRALFLVLLITSLLFHWKNKYEALLINRMQEGKGKLQDISLITGISKFLTILIIIIASIFILGILKINYAGLLAFGGLGGLAVTWAAKDVIANFFGGLMIHINRPFSIGDWIKSTNKNFEGVVEQIGWYMTRIRSLDRRPTYIPNALITDAIIENPGRMYHRPLRMTIGLRYEDYPLLPSIINDLREMLNQQPEVSKNQSTMVHFTNYNQSSIDIEVYCFTRKTQLQEFRDIQQEILFKIGDIIHKHGAELAFPTQTIHLTKNTY